MITVQPQIILCSLILLSSTPAYSQINPDNTLGAESSRVTPNVLINGANADRIDGGAVRGSNLFHSFTQFNINDGQRVYFGNPAGVQNILTRVTGGQASNILGTLGVDGIANLFLINPNGILFGKNGSLDVRGSFVGTTANAVQFGNQGIFSATNPQAAPLLTINPSALLFNQINPNAAIQNNSIAPAGIDPTGFFDVLGLRVPDGKSLLLVGGNVSMDGGQLNAYGGRVELGGLAAPGNINLVFNGDNLSLKIPENVARADVSLTNQAFVYVEGAGGGNIAINARNLEILGGSQLSAGIGEGLGTPATVAGDISLNATGEIKIVGSGSQIYNLVRRNSKGNGGNITIDSGSFSLRDGAALQAYTIGMGNSGSIIINSKDTVVLDGSSLIFTSAEKNAMGNSGNIYITTDSFYATNLGRLIARTNGKGDAGSVTINAPKTVQIQDSDPITGISSGLFSLTNGTGKAGNINISTEQLLIADGGAIAARTVGEGKGGNIKISTKQLLVRNLSGIAAYTYGTGDAGNISIDTGSLSVVNSQIGSITLGKGNAGNLTVRANDSVEVRGKITQVGSNIENPAGLFAQVNVTGEGRGGNLTIETKRLSVSNSGKVQVATFGQGDAGNLLIRATDVEVFDTPVDSLFATGINAGIEIDTDQQVVPPKGKGGTLTIETERLSVRSGGTVSVATSGEGDAGRLLIRASDSVEVMGTSPNGKFKSQITAAVTPDGTGRGGNLQIETGKMIIRDGAEVTVSSLGTGVAGNLDIQARSISLNNQGSISAITNSGNGGDINLNLQELLLLRRNSQISTNAGTAEKGGDGGNINLNSKFIVAVPNENSDISANAFTGKGGNVSIGTQAIFGIEPRPKPTNQSDITASSDLGLQGQITITQPQVQPPQKLIELPTGLVDATTKFAQICPRDRNAKPLGSFVVTGRGSLPPNSFEPLTGTTSLNPLASLDGENANTKQRIVKTDAQMQVYEGSSSQIVEAQGVVKTADGKMMLVTEAPTATPAATSSSAMCPGS
ncbi:filamentous hemagglutinin N-terminal domain-containing protein [Tolypothrix sp. PCC 7910]|nr:filamentous hemagglutinin N-terminal domain-containing protein [Tolypothrix sp. PCC 7910]